MKKLRYKILINAVILLLWSQHIFSSQGQSKPKPNKWRVLGLSTLLTGVNYFALTRVLVPLTVKAGRGSVMPGLAFASWVAIERFVSPRILKHLPQGFFTKDEWKKSQENAMMAATVLYLIPDSVKERLSTIYPALKKAFFKKSYNGVTVKSFEQFQEIAPKIAEIDTNVKNSFQKIITLENTINSLKEKLSSSDSTSKMHTNIEQAMKTSSELYRSEIVNFTNLLIQKESQRKILYENYRIPELENLKNITQDFLTKSASFGFNDFVKNFNSIKDLYTKIEGGILGFVGQGLNYFEGK